MAYGHQLRGQLFVYRHHLINHHYLMQFVDCLTSKLIWINFAHLFMVSLLPFATALMTHTELS